MNILVFPDGETWNALAGCTIVHIPDGLTIEDVEELLDEAKGTDLYDFKGDEDTGSYKIEIPAHVEAMDGIDLQSEAARLIGEDKCDRETLAEIVAQFGGDES